MPRLRSVATEVVAKGNVGNLLQHFVAVRAAHTLATFESSVRGPTTYIDCYAMAPWEPIEKRGPGFPELVGALANASPTSDPVVAAFHAAWRVHPGNLPADPAARLYPNTAMLLAAGLPQVAWNMRLHDIKPSVRTQLELWKLSQPWPVAIDSDWKCSPLVRDCPAAGPALVMLDPLRVVIGKATKPGELRVDDLRLLVGPHCLNLKRRVNDPAAAPAIVTLFSYADSDPDVVDREIRTRVPSWHVARLKLRGRGGRPNMHYQAWWIASHAAIGCANLPEEWAAWIAFRSITPDPSVE